MLQPAVEHRLDHRGRAGQAGRRRHRPAGPVAPPPASVPLRADGPLPAVRLAGHRGAVSRFGSTACKALWRCRACARAVRPREGAVTVDDHAAPVTPPAGLPPAAASRPSTGSPTTRSRSPSPCRPELRETFAFRAGPAPHRAAGRRRRRTCAGRTRSAPPRPTWTGAACCGSGCRQVAGGAFSAFAAAALRGRRHGRGAAAAGPLHHRRSTPDRAPALRARSSPAPASRRCCRWSPPRWPIEPASRFTVLYGNRTRVSVMFAEELADLKDRYPDRLHLVHVLSREPQRVALLSGRLDAERLRPAARRARAGATGGRVVPLRAVRHGGRRAGRCWPRAGVPGAVHTELFHVERRAGRPAPTGDRRRRRRRPRSRSCSTAGRRRFTDGPRRAGARRRAAGARRAAVRLQGRRLLAPAGRKVVDGEVRWPATTRSSPTSWPPATC